MAKSIITQNPQITQTEYDRFGFPLRHDGKSYLFAELAADPSLPLPVERWPRRLVEEKRRREVAR